MEENIKKFLKDSIISNFVDVNNTLKFGEYKEIYPDRYALFFEVDGFQYILFYADYISNDLEFVSENLKKIGIIPKRYLTINGNQDSYVYTASKKETPYVYEPIFDDCFVCGRL